MVLDGPAMRLERRAMQLCPGRADIVCAGVSTLSRHWLSLLAGEENAHSDAFDEPDGPRLTVTAPALYRMGRGSL